MALFLSICISPKDATFILIYKDQAGHQTILVNVGVFKCVINKSGGTDKPVGSVRQAKESVFDIRQFLRPAPIVGHSCPTILPNWLRQVCAAANRGTIQPLRPGHN